MKDGNNVIARVADSHMPMRIMAPEVRRFLLRFQGLSVPQEGMISLFCFRSVLIDTMHAGFWCPFGHNLQGPTCGLAGFVD